MWVDAAVAEIYRSPLAGGARSRSRAACPGGRPGRVNGLSARPARSGGRLGPPRRRRARTGAPRATRAAARGPRPRPRRGAGHRGDPRFALRLRVPGALRRIIVIADNCSDGTARRAADAGAEVWERTDAEQRGKGFALAWAIERLFAEDRALPAVALVDADCGVSPNLLTAFERRLRARRPRPPGRLCRRQSRGLRCSGPAFRRLRACRPRPLSRQAAARALLRAGRHRDGVQAGAARAHPLGHHGPGRGWRIPHADRARRRAGGVRAGGLGQPGRAHLAEGEQRAAGTLGIRPAPS